MLDEQPSDTMHIGELADRAGMSLRTIRHYDEVGLLVPSGRTAGGFRVYTERDLERLLVIRRMKPLGFSLDEMGDLLRIVDGLPVSPDDAETDPDDTTGPDDTAGTDDTAARAARLDAFLQDARDRHAKLVDRAAMAEEFIGTLTALRAALP